MAVRLSPDAPAPAVKRKAAADAVGNEEQDDMSAASGGDEPQPAAILHLKKPRAPDWTEDNKLLLIKYAKLHWGPQKGKANDGVLKSSTEVIKQALAAAHSV